MPPAFLELSLVLVLATATGILARFFKQPLIVAYIFAGVVVASLGYFKSFDKVFFETLSNLGIAFLLFLVGIDLRLADIKYVGKAAILTGLGQIAFTALAGFFIVAGLGYAVVPAVYISVALTFSSTVIIVKLLSEKGDLQSLYGKIAVGFLLVQDFVAVLALVLLSGIKAGEPLHFGAILLVFVKAVILVAIAYICARSLLKAVFNLAASSPELLFVAAIAWAFFFSTLATFFGFSLAIGAFLAGLAIASSQYRVQISARVRPLRDFFVIIFFILLGATMGLGSTSVPVGEVVLLSLFILIGNPLIVFAVMLSLGYKNRTSFLASVTVAQISEFSLILMAVGQSLGHVTQQMVSLVAAIGIVTITLSSYLILYGEKLYRFMSVPINKFFPEKGKDPYVVNRETLKGHVVLVGAEQMGSDILNFLKTRYKSKDHILVVDYNPEIIKHLKAEGYNAVLGDISDPEVLEELELSRAKLIIVTDSNLGDNEHLINFARSKNYKGPIIGTAYWFLDGVKLYEYGADYVIVPEFVGGKHVSRILAEDWDNLDELKKSKSKHFDELLAHKVF